MRLIGPVVSILIGFVVLAGLWQGVSAMGNLGYEPAPLRATSTGLHAASIAISGYPDSYACHGSDGGPHPDWVSYCPSTSLEVPAHSLITVTIEQYDTGTALHNTFFEQVQGTVGGTMQVDGHTVSGLFGGNGDIAHTFTIQSEPDSPQYLYVSVPVAAVPDTAPNAVTINGHQYPKPTVTVFQFETGAPGHYIWHCYDPCGTGLAGDNNNFGGPMATTGYMSGTLTIV